MHIVVNTRLLLKNKLEGIGWYTYEVLKRITQKHPEHQFTFLFDRPFEEEYLFGPNVSGIVLSPPARHPILWYIWFQFSVKCFLKKHKPDLFISPDGYIPLGLKTPTIAVIHDINFKHYPLDFPASSRLFYNWFFPKFAKEATKIVTVSEFSKDDIVNSYLIESSKIKVTYNGCNEIFKPISDEVKSLTKNKLSNGSDFFVYVGGLNPRKNICNLLLAFDDFKKTNSSRMKLLIVGEKMFGTASLHNTYKQLNFKEDVIFTGRLNSKDLNDVIASSSGLTLVSNFEGFGIPILEAFHCEVPVITSNITSMPEVAGDAALLVSPCSVASIAKAMTQLTSDEDLKRNLVEMGRKQRELYSWDKTANGLWELIEEMKK